MTPITYRLSPGNFRFRLTLMWMMIGLAGLSLAVLALQIWYANSSGGVVSINLGHFASLLLALGLCVWGVPGRLLILPERNFMTLDDAGLRHVRMGVGQWWPWRDLPAFSVTAHPGDARVVEFRPPAARGLRSRLAFWVVWLADGWFVAGHRVIRLSDLYDAPIGEIAVALNEYRKHALGGGDASGGPAVGAAV
jgi:hypothetical protein